MRILSRQLSLLTGLLLIGSTARSLVSLDPTSQDEEGGAVSTVTSEDPPAAQDRDPFGSSELLEELREEAARQDPTEFVPGPVGSRRPSITLRGYIEDGVQPPLALVEINNGAPLVVREGDTISLQDGTSNTVIQVVSVGNLSVSVRVGTIEELLIIR